MITPSRSETADASPLRLTLRWPVVRQCLLIMVIVGTLLNLVNQGEALFAWNGVNWFKAALTYCVPFLVSLFGAYSANRAFCHP